MSIILLSDFAQSAMRERHWTPCLRQAEHDGWRPVVERGFRAAILLFAADARLVFSSQ
jgi:hypothetical protein